MMIALWVVGGVLVLFALTAFTGAPYVPSHRRDIQRVFREGVKLTKDDVVLDIGAGDGIAFQRAQRAGELAYRLSHLRKAEGGVCAGGVPALCRQRR